MEPAAGTGESLARQGDAVLKPAILGSFPQFVVQEGRAVEIWLFELGAMQGLFQSQTYAAAIVEGLDSGGAITEKQPEERPALLTERQRSLERTTPPRINAVMDESCIRLQGGVPEVMAEAWGRLVDVTRLPNTVIQIAPFSLRERRSLNKAGALATLPDRSQISYAESAHSGQLQRNARFVGPLLTSYHQLQVEALSQADSIAMVNQLRKGMS
ncbi:DUF5753 domain-containing protein [Streptomyces sp. NRRL F-6628]|uniref:DUF5753 domain-containing protein n=1 Tax=Streptomyces sp. NRRL F-6628 TaxID=1463876 RepID=UPI00068E5DCA|nr:DUF5753 domain-containing protein [Streptomyces sp. NRRL F-6628]